MTYEDFAAAANNGGRPVRVQRLGGGVAGLAELDYGNRVTVRWETGEQSRIGIDELQLAGSDEERCADCGRTVKACDVDYGGSGAPRPAHASVWASDVGACPGRERRMASD